MKITPVNYYYDYKGPTFNADNQAAKRSTNNMMMASAAVGLSVLALFVLVFRHKIINFCNKSKEPVSQAGDFYRENIAKAVSKILKKDVTPENLSFVVSKNEFDIDFKTLTKQPGQSAKDVLEKFASATEEYTVGIADKDSVGFLKKVLLEIVKNPEKYKNLRLVPGVKFSVKDNNVVSEWSVFCVNPFSKNLNYYVNSFPKRYTGIAHRKDTIDRILNAEQDIIIL